MKASHLEPSLNRKERRPVQVGPLAATHLESLEHRMLFAAAVLNRTLVVDGTAASDSIGVDPSGSQIAVTVNGVQTNFNASDVDAVTINGLGGDDGLGANVNLPVAVTGGPGDDTIATGSGNDTFTWNPGDGSDVTDGREGTDTFTFNGAGGADSIVVGKFATLLKITTVGPVNLAIVGCENVNVNALDGADNITIDDLAGTDVQNVTVVTGGNGSGDGSVDFVTFNGTNNDDNAQLFTDNDSLSLVTGNVAVNLVKLDITNDRIFYNGNGANDTLAVNGTLADDTFNVTPNGTLVRVDRAVPIPQFDIGTTENITVNGLGGADTLTGLNGLGTLTKLTFDGGTGNDSLRGGDGADILIGGDGNDFVDGNIGADSVSLGNDNDTFNWDPGDGSDVVEGQAGNDTLQFNGSAIGEVIDMSAQAGRFKLTRNIGAIVMDIDDIENVKLRALAGTDTVTVGNLAGTDIADIRIDLAGTSGGTDAAADAITVTGTTSADTVEIAGIEGSATVSGLPHAITIENLDATLDALTVNTLAGNDVVNAVNLDVATLKAVTMNGGADNDSLTGGDGADFIVGETGNDTVDANAGADIVNLGEDADAFIWNPGDGSDVLDGGAGTDSLTFNGSSSAEQIAIVPDAAGVIITRSVGSIVMGIAGTETINLNALGGADTINIFDLSFTSTNAINLDLASSIGGSTGDSQPDVVNITGTDIADIAQISGGIGDLSLISNNTAIQISHNEAVTDAINYTSLLGADTLFWLGQSISDTMDVSASGAKIRLARSSDSFRVDLDDVENLSLIGQGGADTMTFNSLAGTEAVNITADLQSSPGSNTPDGQNDSVTLVGTTANNNLSLQDIAGGTTVNGLGYKLSVVRADAGDWLRINSLQGFDGITLNQLGLEGSLRKVLVDAGADTDTLNVLQTAADGVVTILPSAGNDTVAINAGPGGTANATLESTTRLGTLNVSFGATLKLPVGGNVVLTTSQLNMTSNGKIDLADNAIIVDYPGLTPLPLMSNYIYGGHANGHWNGNGINSSVAAVTPNTGIGFTEASAIFGSFPATYRGQSVDNTSVIFAYTLLGDANLDSDVDTSDFTVLAQNFSQLGKYWGQGDFTYNTAVNALDFNSLATNFGKVVQPIAAPPAAAVARANLFAEGPVFGDVLRGFLWTDSNSQVPLQL